MVVLCAIVTPLTCLVCLVWVTRHLKITREQRPGSTLTGDRPGPPEDPPPISVLVAAKDEEACIERCVRSMLEQDYPDFELIVCNDRSEDATPAIVRRIADEDARVRLLNIEHLPEGWCGKNNAMQTGIRTARGDWICMIDADCRQTSSRTLSVAMQYALDNKCDLLSVLPRLEMLGFWENVIQPVCGGVMMIWHDAEKVNNPDKPNAYANGAFMLMRRDTYEAIGTHEAVKDRVNEDMYMAARAKQSGRRLRLIRGDELYMVRMYTSLERILRGWGRIFFGTFGTLRRLTISLAVLVLMGLLPYAAVALGLSLGGVWGTICALSGVGAAAMQLTVIFRYYRLLGGAPWLAWTYPLGCVMTMISLVSAIGKLRRGAKVVWKSTAYVRPGR